MTPPHTLLKGDTMSDAASFETSLIAERDRIWQRYKAGDLDVEVATAQLLRLDIDERSVARILRQTELLRLA
jgi:phage protein D